MINDDNTDHFYICSVLNLGTEGPSDHSNDPIGSGINNIINLVKY